MKTLNCFAALLVLSAIGGSCGKVNPEDFKGPEFKRSAESFTRRIQRADSVTFSYAYTIKSYFVGQSEASALQFDVHYPAGTTLTQQQAEWQLSELEKLAQEELVNPEDFDRILVRLTNGTEERTAEKEFANKKAGL